MHIHIPLAKNRQGRRGGRARRMLDMIGHAEQAVGRIHGIGRKRRWLTVERTTFGGKTVGTRIRYTQCHKQVRATFLARVGHGRVPKYYVVPMLPHHRRHTLEPIFERCDIVLLTTVFGAQGLRRKRHAPIVRHGSGRGRRVPGTESRTFVIGKRASAPWTTRHETLRLSKMPRIHAQRYLDRTGPFQATAG